MSGLHGILHRLDEEYFDQLRQLMAWHKEIAVAATLDHCAERSLVPPSWIVEPAAQFLPALLHGRGSGRRGRSCNPVARYRQDQIDYLRWDSVVYTRAKQPEIRERVAVAREYKSYPSRYLELEEKLEDWIGSDWIRAFEVASMYLQGSYSHGGPDAVKVSYLKVQKHFKRNEGMRYVMVREPFRSAIGIPHPSTEKQGKNCRHIFELTL